MTETGPKAPPAAAAPAVAPPGRRFRLDPWRDAWKILVVLGVLLLLDAGFTLFFLRPQSRAVAALEAEKANFDMTYKQAKRQAEAAKADYDTAALRQAEYQDFYEKALSTSLRRLAPVHAEIWRIGRQFQTVPDPLNVNPQDLEEQGVQQLTISFPLDGGYENLRRFIDALERSEQLLIVDRVTMAENSAQSGAVRLTIDVSTFFNAPQATEFMKQSREIQRRGGRRPR